MICKITEDYDLVISWRIIGTVIAIETETETGIGIVTGGETAPSPASRPSSSGTGTVAGIASETT